MRMGLFSPSGRRSRRRAFTLIEMLVVIVIIAILSGFVFRMVKVIGRNADRAKTRRTLELLANAVEEFRAEYGKYPPVAVYDDPFTDAPGQPMRYEFAHESGVDGGRVQGIKGNDDPLFMFGLMSFLVPRYDGAATNSPQNALDSRQWTEHNQSTRDRPRDLRATLRFKPYIDPIRYTDWTTRTSGGTEYYNRYYSVLDAWYRDLHYRSRPPYETYRLWSVGPDGINGTKDDIVVGTE